MSTLAFDTKIGTFKQFKSYVSKYGYSITNFYDVNFELTNSQQNLNDIFKRVPGGTRINTADSSNVRDLMRFYAEECSIPGFQISTGEYRITNTPQLKYAYGIVNNEINFSFIGDANADIRKTFDAWQSYIYAHNLPARLDPTAGNLNINTREFLGRTRYRDEYVSDIIVVKYEKTGMFEVTNTKKKKFIPANEIIPDYVQSKTTKPVSSGFAEAVPLYSVRLMNAFPTNISSIPLSSGASDLVKVQVTFEYETAVTSAHNNGTVRGQIETII